MNFFTKWITDFAKIFLALAFAIVFMQAPAFTNQYLTVIQEIIRESRKDIELRKEVAIRFYRLPREDKEFLEKLQEREPANAEGLRISIEYNNTLNNILQEIKSYNSLVQPFIMIKYNLANNQERSYELFNSLYEKYEVQTVFNKTSAIYASIGLFIGLLMYNLLLLFTIGIYRCCVITCKSTVFMFRKKQKI